MLLDGRAGLRLDLPPGWERTHAAPRVESWLGPGGVSLRAEHLPGQVLVDTFLLDDQRQDLRLIAAERGGGLIECEPFLGQRGVLGLIKLPAGPEGLRVEGHALVPLAEGHLSLRLDAEHPQGRRRDREAPADPYGQPYQRPARDRDFARHRLPSDLLLRTPADDAVHDEAFPEHPLSRVRAAIRLLMAGLDLQRPSLYEVESDTVAVQGARFGLPLGFLAEDHGTARLRRQEDGPPRGQIFRRRTFAGRSSSLRVELLPGAELASRSAAEACRLLPGLASGADVVQGPRALERTVGRYPGVYAEVELHGTNATARYACAFLVPWRDGASLLFLLSVAKDDWARANRDLEAVICCLTPWEEPDPEERPAESGDDTHKFAHVSLNGLRRIYRVLCRLAHCDGRVDPRERTVLETFCRRFKITGAEAAALEAEARENERLRIGRKPAERALLVHAMLLVAAADDVLHPAEEKRLEAIARTVELPQAELTARIKGQFGRS